MNPEIFEQSIKSIQEKIGEEITAKIADDIGALKTAQNDALNFQKEQAEKLELAIRDKQDMQAANSRLLQQIPMGEKPEHNLDIQTKEPEEKFDPRSAFDEHGRLK